jgi:hypothetical protein
MRRARSQTMTMFRSMRGVWVRDVMRGSVGGGLRIIAYKVKSALQFARQLGASVHESAGYWRARARAPRLPASPPPTQLSGCQALSTHSPRTRVTVASATCHAGASP